jgi:hypothetical protein
MILEVFPPGPSPPSSRKLLAEAESTRNSFPWTILQGTSLFSRFYSATMLATSRKQGICLQNMGGGGQAMTGVQGTGPWRQVFIAWVKS